MRFTRLFGVSWQEKLQHSPQNLLFSRSKIKKGILENVAFLKNVVSIFYRLAVNEKLNSEIFQNYLLELLQLNSIYDILNMGSVFDEISMSKKIDLVKRNGERVTSRQIAYILEKYAERQGLQTKSTHKMRKTYASLLASNGVPLDAIRELLGHTDLSTTLGYIYNPLPEKDTYELISKAL